MATMKQCLECGNAVSSEASSCPHCNTGFPHGAKCMVCLEPTQVSKAVEVTLNGSYGPFVVHLHPDCHHKTNTFEYSCPACKNKITEVPSPSLNASCKNCGQPLPVTYCYYCGQSIIKGRSGATEITVKTEPGTGLPCSEKRTVWAHKVCTQSQSKGAKCFIATAVYGDINCDEVRLLRNFRDRVLLKHMVSRSIVSFYYVISPPIAKYISHRPRLRTPLRHVFDIFVSCLSGKKHRMNRGDPRDGSRTNS